MNIQKSSQAAAFFLLEESRMPVLKLMKLLYISDRKSLSEYGYPITLDKMVSMPHGPVLSGIYDLINNTDPDSYWNHLISDRKDHNVSLKNSVKVEDLQELSKADLEILQNVWDSFGHMDQWELSDYTHDNFKEWKDPCGSAYPISFSDVLKEVGYDDNEAIELDKEINGLISVNNQFKSIGLC